MEGNKVEPSDYQDEEEYHLHHLQCGSNQVSSERAGCWGRDSKPHLGVANWPCAWALMGLIVGFGEAIWCPR